MSEPEELIIEGAHFATRIARDAWRRYGPTASDAGLRLASVRARLELFATALVGAPIAIAPLEPPAPRTWLSKLVGASRARPPLCATDGNRVYLPVLLDHPDGDERALDLYRLLTIQQALRLLRGSRRTFAGIRDPRVRDWFMLAEAAIVDRCIAVTAPGLVRALDEARARALAARPAAVPGGPSGSALERQVRALLAAAADERTVRLPDDAAPDVCREWAAGRARHDDDSPQLFAIALPAYWGEFIEPFAVAATALPDTTASPDDRQARRPRVSELRRRPRIRQTLEDEDDSAAGTWVIRADEPQESIEDPFGLQRPVDRQGDEDPEGLADSLADLPEARVVRTPGRPREVLRGADSLLPGRPVSFRVESPSGIAYPEWDYRRAEYRLPGAIVHLRDAAAGDDAWVTSTLARHATLVHRVRTRFERLRPRPMRYFRQIEGADIDIAAYVTGDADRRAGVTMDGRLYVAVRPARRELAVSLLLDVSASTDAWVSAGRRIVDVEKEAMLIVCEALDALGDRYGLFAFSGEGPEDVLLLTLKSFDERAGSRVHRRIAALDSDRYTRLGAPIRHVTAALCRENASRRLLLVLSDGKPNDVDMYEGDYGVEDTHRAVAEARRQGVCVFCLTVDREAPRYVGRTFGRNGFAVLRRPEQLPAVVIDVLRQLVRA